MTTQSEQIDAQIKKLQEQLNSPKKEHKEEKTIDEQIKDLQEQLDGTPKRPTPSETIDEQIKRLQEQLSLPKTKEEIDSCLDTFHEEEKVLLAKIKAKSTIIYYLTIELDAAKQQKEYLEKQLKSLGEWIVRTARDN